MKNLKYIFAGVFFGFALTKGEAISWFRIQEMFRFESFHMFGIFITAVATGSLSIFLIRQLSLRTISGEAIVMPEKKYHRGIIFGSLIFGFGWSLTGSCPGPIYAQIGSGYAISLVTLIGAIAGTWTYGALQRFLPE